MKSDKKAGQNLLAALPSVDELLKSHSGMKWLTQFKRTIVLRAIREILAEKRKDIHEGRPSAVSTESLEPEILTRIGKLSSFSLVPVINATGIVVHTNLGRAALADEALKNVVKAGRGYSNLEYDLDAGKRGKRHAHTKDLLREITGAEDAFIVNNNAAAVLISLNTIAKGKEVIVSRGELVEIGGSFRVPDVMTASGALLREVGTTNKTHFHDYSDAINDNTGLILKVHQSNYKIIGFADDVPVDKLVSLGKKHGIPVAYDLGSGCLIDLKKYGIYDEPSVREIVNSGIDIVSFSGDKLLGGPQGGIIAGKKQYIEKIQKNPLARALRIDKLTIAAFEATLMEYLDIEAAIKNIPVLAMLFQPIQDISARAEKIASGIKKTGPGEDVRVIEDFSKAGGGSLPETVFHTHAVSIKPSRITVNQLEERLRRGSPPVIGRIKTETLLLDARTIRESEIETVIQAVRSALGK